jgi:hypothetical protein
MSENNSFVDEVTEEVRRDKLYLFLKRYVWILILLIVTIILASVFFEVKSNANKVKSEEIGELLLKSLSNEVDEMDDLATFTESKPLLVMMLRAKVLENKLDYNGAVRVYETLLNLKSIPNSFKDFVKFKILLLVKDDPIKSNKLLIDLVNPDSSFNLLALEQRVFRDIKENNWKDAVANIELLLSDPEASQAMISRANQIKKAINLDSL